MTLEFLKNKTQKTSEYIFDIISPEDYMCPCIDKMIKEVKSNCREILSSIKDQDMSSIEFYTSIIKDDTESDLEELRSRIDHLRDWGEQWKTLAKNLYDELTKLDSSVCGKYLNSKIT